MFRLPCSLFMLYIFRCLSFSQWIAQTSGTATTIAAVAAANNQTYVAVGATGLILRSTDGGAAWSQQTSGVSIDLFGVHFINDTVGTATVFLGTILRSSDGGVNWSPQTSGVSNYLFSVFFLDQNNGYCVGQGGVILHTTNGGTTWSPQTSGTTRDLSCVKFSNVSSGLIVGGNGTILRTTNGGTSWSSPNSGTTSFLSSVDFADASIAFAVGTNGTILKSTNGGVNWSILPSGTSAYLTSVSFTNSSTGVIVGAGEMILRTTNSGSTWFQQTSGTSGQLNSIVMTDADNGIAVGSGGVVLRTVNGGFELFSKMISSPVANDASVSFGSGWMDYDGDNDLDLFVANFNNQNDNLYRNDGDGVFTKMTSGQVGTVVASGGSSFGANWGDYDNDGHPDLFVANADNQNDFLFHNNGDGTFTRVTTGSIVTSGGYTTGSSWVDYDNDGHLDLLAVNNNQVNFLFHNNGDGTFTRITTGHMLTTTDRFHGCSWADYDNDGDMDVFIACNINTKSRLYRNDSGGVFTNITTGDLVNDVGSAQGASWGDYDNDGDLDIFVPERSNLNNNLYRNNGDGTFTKMTGIEVGSLVNDGGDSFGSAWSDVDNDGDLDLFVANWSGENNFFYWNNGDGTFTREFSGKFVNDGGESQACSWGDFDRDGFEDLFVSNGFTTNENDFLYRNNGNSNHWITLRLKGTVSNRSAIGVKVRAKAVISGQPVWQFREVAQQSGAFGHNSFDVHFGFGDATVIDSVTIEWPYERRIQRFFNVNTNQFLSVTEPDWTILGVPTLMSPSDNSIQSPTVTFGWHKVNDIEYYHAQVASDSLFTSLIFQDSSLTDSGFVLSALDSGSTYFWRVRSFRDTLRSDWSAMRHFIVSNFTVGITLRSKWNLVSISLDLIDKHYLSVFPSASASILAYDSGGYNAFDSLEIGRGYWIKLPQAEEAVLTGFPAVAETITVVQGWNLIGSIATALPVSAVMSNPPGIPTSSFFQYDGSYSVSDTIKPGKGYWVKTASSGLLILSSSQEDLTAAENKIRIILEAEQPPAAPASSADRIHVPLEYQLFQNYPNPFNPMTEIRFQISEVSMVTLKVHDVLGREVAVLVNERKEAGEYAVTWDASRFPSGLYFYSISTGNFGKTRKLLLLK